MNLVVHQPLCLNLRVKSFYQIELYPISAIGFNQGSSRCCCSTGCFDRKFQGLFEINDH